jgi:hypothetical protein
MHAQLGQEPVNIGGFRLLPAEILKETAIKTFILTNSRISGASISVATLPATRPPAAQ